MEYSTLLKIKQIFFLYIVLRIYTTSYNQNNKINKVNTVAQACNPCTL